MRTDKSGTARQKNFWIAVGHELIESNILMRGLMFLGISRSLPGRSLGFVDSRRAARILGIHQRYLGSKNGGKFPLLPVTISSESKWPCSLTPNSRWRIWLSFRMGQRRSLPTVCLRLEWGVEAR